MCGIAGFISAPTSTEESSLEVMERIVKSMNNRGPDAGSIWASEGVLLGHRRLAIIDLDSRANQPMLSSDSRYAIVFNGEVYNFDELRCELESEGVVFCTTSDTEILLAMYARDGELMLTKLRGMFAFGIWDKQTKELFLARDPYGIKPLYYTSTKNGLIFASQVKALLASGMVSKKLEPAGVAGFYLWGSVLEPWTLYRDVFALPAGHYMRVSEGVAEASVLWRDIGDDWCKKGNQLSTQQLKEKVQKAVRDSVRAHMVADVPVCIFLSGGIDSAVIAGIASELGTKIEAITLGFDEFKGQAEDEVPFAKAIAKHYGLSHFVRRISRAEFEEDIPKILNAMDQPSIDGVNTWFASKVAAERGYKVALSGIGADEIFSGYPSFWQVPYTAALGLLIFRIPFARLILKKVGSIFARILDKPKLSAFSDFMDSLEGAYFLRRCLFLPGELHALMGLDMAREGLDRLAGNPPGMVKINARDGVTAVGLMESTYYLRNQLLRDSDWASMNHSLELRTPFVDIQLLKALGPYVSNFSGGVGKSILAHSPKNSLPKHILDRPKNGFSLPMSQWLSEASDKNAWNNQIVLTGNNGLWARRWAKLVMQRLAE